MNKLILAGIIVMTGLPAAAGAAQATSHDRGERYAARYVDYARAECILPWYRFFGACDEAIQDPPDGKNWHPWANGGHRRWHH